MQPGEGEDAHLVPYKEHIVGDCIQHSDSSRARARDRHSSSLPSACSRALFSCIHNSRDGQILRFPSLNQQQLYLGIA